MAQSTRTMKHIIPCQDGQKELSDIMLTMEKYSVETQTREKKWKVIFHKQGNIHKVIFHKLSQVIIFSQAITFFTGTHQMTSSIKNAPAFLFEWV